MEIPARTIQLISGQLDSPYGCNSVMLVEPLSNLLEHLHIACSLSAVYNNQVTVQVINYSPSPVKIFKGMKLATAIPKRNILLVSD